MKNITLDLIALLFVAREPLPEKELIRLLGEGALQALQALEQQWATENYPLQIVSQGEGYILKTRPSYQPLIDSLYRGPGKERLSKAALEVLAIILHKGPVARSTIDQLRGVDCLGPLQSLMDKELIESSPCPTKKIPLYKPTEKFLCQIQGSGEINPLSPASPAPVPESGSAP